jgi:hypothetical protein
MVYKRKPLTSEKIQRDQIMLYDMMLNRILNRGVVPLMIPIVKKIIIVFIWKDAELNALSNEHQLNFYYFQKLVCFDQILNHYEYIKDPKKPI